jgi:hypothetical protein
MPLLRVILLILVIGTYRTADPPDLIYSERNAIIYLNLHAN